MGIHKIFEIQPLVAGPSWRKIAFARESLKTGRHRFFGPPKQPAATEELEDYAGDAALSSASLMVP